MVVPTDEKAIDGDGLPKMLFTLLERWEAPMILTTLVGLKIFFLVVVSLSLRYGGILFLDPHGWRHRISGAMHLSWLVYGCLCITSQVQGSRQAFLYDVVLGCFGLTATLTAARDFPHRYVHNAVGQSGTLSEQAMVTQGEMIEHAFYQFLNIWQALFLHLIAWNPQWSDWQRWITLWCVTSPWYVRSHFPVNSFSQNWKNAPSEKQSDLETLLYRIKKGQYLFYKHVVLHGVNLAICIQPSSLVTTKPWRIFWLCLNTAYVMEFFLQSLVRRKVVSQPAMLWLNRLLMAVSSLAAVPAIVGTVRWELCLFSLVLNFCHRHHEVLNTMCLASAVLVLARL
jgi:hypothetical protein